jgi:ribose/xylose/arabinose/galactoside ABC-type transport system permease subunit
MCDLTTRDAIPAIRKLRGALSSSPVYMGLILLALIGVFSALRPDTFLSLFNIRNIIFDASVLLVLAVGMTSVVISGGFDLTIGSVLVFAGIAAALTMNAMRTDDWFTVLTGARRFSYVWTGLGSVQRALYCPTDCRLVAAPWHQHRAHQTVKSHPMVIPLGNRAYR